MNKLKFISLILLGYSSTTSAMWTEDSHGNTIHTKTPIVKTAKAPKQYYIDIVIGDPAPKAKAKAVAPVAKIDTPFKADINKGELAIDNKGKKVVGQTKKDEECLAYSIFREAGTLSENAQLAVGQVHINRLKEGSWGDRMCQVVHYKAQFSWTMERYVNWSAKQREKYLAQAHALMNGVRVKKLDSEDILHYHADYVNPKWAKQGTLVAKAGAHLFYKDVPF